MRIAYKALVSRFNIPRPTLIEWQKRLEDDPKNWRSAHLNYLRDQLLIEEETLKEISRMGILIEEYFLMAVFLFFTSSKKSMDKKEFIMNLRKFSVTLDSSVEYQHPFSKRIWKECVIDEQKVRMLPYFSLVVIIEKMTSAQYYCLVYTLEELVGEIKEKLSIIKKPKLIGCTWQELHMFDKAFSLDFLSKKLEQRNLLH